MFAVFSFTCSSIKESIEQGDDKSDMFGYSEFAFKDGLPRNFPVFNSHQLNTQMFSNVFTWYLVWTRSVQLLYRKRNLEVQDSNSLAARAV